MGNNRNLYQRKPRGGPCSFTQKLFASSNPAKYWLHVAGGPGLASFSTRQDVDFLEITNLPRTNTGFAIQLPSAAWLTGTTVIGREYTATMCYNPISLYTNSEGIFSNTPSPYVIFAPPPTNSVTTYDPTAVIDVWRAYADGLWTSSVQFRVLVQTFFTLDNAQITARAYTSKFPSVTSSFLTSANFYNCVPTTWGSQPGNTGLKIVTVYDDGTITIT